MDIISFTLNNQPMATTTTAPVPAAVTAEIETLQQLRTVHMAKANYFSNLASNLPCDVSIVFQDKEGRVKIMDLVTDETVVGKAGFAIATFAFGMEAYHREQLSTINLALQNLRTSQD